MAWRRTYVHARPDEVGAPMEDYLQANPDFPLAPVGRYYVCQVCDDDTPIPEAEVVIRANIFEVGYLTIVCSYCDRYADCDGPCEDDEECA